MSDNNTPLNANQAQPGRARWSRGRRIGASVAASGVLLGTGIGLGVALTGGASAATSAATTSDSSASGQAARHCAAAAKKLAASGHPVAARRARALCKAERLRFVLTHGVHGQVTYKDKSGFATVAFERGTVESVSSSAVTVEAADGTTWTWDIVAKTVVRQSGHTVAEHTLAQGDKVLVAGQVVSGAYDARLIRIRAAS
jgi:hypothetical protein